MEIGMADTRVVDLDEDLTLAWLWDWDVLEDELCQRTWLAMTARNEMIM